MHHRQDQHDTKMASKTTLHRNNTACIFGCSVIEDQEHVFTQCQPILTKIENGNNLSYMNIFGSLQEQVEIIPKLYQIEVTRNHMKEHLVPGGTCRQDPCLEA